MNDQYFVKDSNTSEFVEDTDKDVNSSVVNSDPFADKAPVLAALIQQTPLGGPLAAITPPEAIIVDDADGAPIDKTIPGAASNVETITYEPPSGGTNTGISTSLLDRDESEHLRTRWKEIQGKFVDEPRSAVQQADELVSEVIEKITQIFADEHSSLEGQWNQGNDVSTEDLRKALQHYRSFFNRLVV